MARILLADDETVGRDLARRTLEAAGHSVDCADNGLDAAAMLAPGRYDLLVSDIQMPGMDGIELATQALAADMALRVVLMSGFPDGFGKADGLKPRLRAVLAKPVAPADLVKAVAAALG